MQIRTSLFCLAWLSLLSVSHGQPLATTVQLPTLQVFTVDTTVSVPDRGRLMLGGISRQRSGRNQFWPPLVGSRPGIGVETGASRLHVAATIMDLSELDRQVLAAARQRPAPTDRSTGDAPPSRDLTRIARAISTDKVAAASVAEIRRAQVQEQDDSQRQGEAYLEQALSAEEGGKLGAAKVYYQMAARRLTGNLQQDALARLTALREQTLDNKAAKKPTAPRAP